jgi:methanogenic corrinoid protein MtbC1
MDGEDRITGHSLSYAAALPDVACDLDAYFTADHYRGLREAAARRERIAEVVAVEIVPRLAALHAAVLPPDHPTTANITELAQLVLSSDAREAAAYVASLRDSGLSVDLLFEELLEPAARLLGELWNEDDLDFIDVTLGVARLQALLSVFNCTHALAARSTRRSVLMMTVPGEQHSFGITMVEQFLAAGGWQVASERELSPELLAALVAKEWFAVVGIALSKERDLEAAAAAVAMVRKHSCNDTIGVMVGGPVFNADGDRAREIGADGTAASGPSAVVLAQKLLDRALASPATLRSLTTHSGAGSDRATAS